MKYNVEKKAQAIARMAEIGVAKTSEEMNISVQTLYKWRNKQNGNPTEQMPEDVDSDIAELVKLVKSGDVLEGKVKELEEENAKLRLTNTRLKKAIVALME